MGLLKVKAEGLVVPVARGRKGDQGIPGPEGPVGPAGPNVLRSLTYPHANAASPFGAKTVVAKGDTISYTVPAGKVLYITQSLGLSTSGQLTINGMPVFYGLSTFLLQQPALAKAGDVVTTSSTRGGWSGFLVDAEPEIEPASVSAHGSTPYTVPAGKRFVILNAASTSTTQELRANFGDGLITVAYRPGMNTVGALGHPIIADAGTVLVGLYANDLSVHGYMVAQA